MVVLPSSSDHGRLMFLSAMSAESRQPVINAGNHSQQGDTVTVTRRCPFVDIVEDIVP